MYDLKTGKELKKFNTEIGTILSISAEKKDDFVNLQILIKTKHKNYKVTLINLLHLKVLL